MTTRRTFGSARQALLRRVARHAPRPPDRLLPALLEMASAARRTGPSLLPPAADRVLVLVPHPDDESIGAGGLLALLAERGAEVELLLVTDGEATLGSRWTPVETGRRRRAEFERAVAIIGGRSLPALGLPDGEVEQHRDRLITAVHAALLDVAPDLVLAPWPLEAHPDHRAVAEATAEALLLVGWSSGGGRVPRLWTYEAHTPILMPSHVVDVTGRSDVKRAALEEHVTAAGAFDLTACLGLAQWRSLVTRAGRGHAEAFLELTPEDVLTLVACAADLPARAHAGSSGVEALA